MALKDSFINLNKALRTTLENVPAVVDTLERGFSKIGEDISTSADVKKATNNFETINGGLLSECKVTLSPIQDLSHGDPSPDNICPISGHTQVEVDVSDGQTIQEQVTVNLGGTYYSGTLDVVSGVFTPDTASVDLGTLTWGAQSTSVTGKNRFRTGDISSVDKKPSANNVVAEIISSNYKAITAENTYSLNDEGVSLDTTGAILIYDSTKETLTAEQFKTAMSGVQLVYKLATPTPIQLSPTMVKALVGENQLDTPLDRQEIAEVEYKEIFTYSDVEIAIDNAIASVYPEAPAADGSYVLTLVKDGTSITRSWVSTEP